MDVRVGLWWKLNTKELMLLNCDVGEDSWESLGLQGDPPVHSEGDQPWDFFGVNDSKAATPVLRPPQAKSWLIGKDFDAGKDWGQEEKGTTEDEMVGWHHWLNGREPEWTPGVGDGQGGLACCDSWGRKELDTTERLNWTELNCGRWEGSAYWQQWAEMAEHWEDQGTVTVRKCGCSGGRRTQLYHWVVVRSRSRGFLTSLSPFPHLWNGDNTQLQESWRKEIMYVKFPAHNRHLINGSSSYYFKNSMNIDNGSL